MKTWKVCSLDVWGHAPSECEEPNEKTGECECEGFRVNDEFNIGTIELDELEGTEDQKILDALIENGFLDANVTLEEAELGQDSESFIDIRQKVDGRPVLFLYEVTA